MSEDVDEIRKQKARDLMAALDSDDEAERKAAEDVLPWAYRFTVAGHNDDGDEVGVFQILQQGNVIAMTQDHRFAELVTDQLNRLALVVDSGILDGEWP
jgi:hypothetical protein